MTQCFAAREPAVLVTTVSIHKGDLGSVIVGGRVTKNMPRDSSFERYWVTKLTVN